MFRTPSKLLARGKNVVGLPFHRKSPAHPKAAAEEEGEGHSGAAREGEKSKLSRTTAEAANNDNVNSDGAKNDTATPTAVAVATADEKNEPQYTDIRPLLQRLWPPPSQSSGGVQTVAASEIATAISHIFTNSLSPVQTCALLTALHMSEQDLRPDVLVAVAASMRQHATPVDLAHLHTSIAAKTPKMQTGTYQGGLCDIVGTGGDAHNTFNISTTASIIASSYLLLAKHGNRASTSRSGSADLLRSMRPHAPDLTAITATTLPQLYEKTNYAFLYAPVFHPGMKHVASVRKQLGWRTIFNLIGPLASPVEEVLEARVLGVARKALGRVFAEALRQAGSRRALVVCGKEDLDEISCAGETLCWRLVAKDGENKEMVEIEEFTLMPEDFGLSRHPLDNVSPGQSPEQNAAILEKILKGQVDREDPILDFVMMNTAALLVVSGVCDGEGEDVVMEVGPGGGRWKEGVRKAELAVRSGEAWRMWEAFVGASREFGES